MQLPEELRKFIVETIKKGDSLPEDLKYLLFPSSQKEYELTYAGKMRKEDLLANEDGVFPVPLQVEKIFNGDEHESFKDGWRNMIVFGDNLQFLKTIYENKSDLIKNKIKGKVKLIYIDPPFATTDEFQNKEGAKAYTDKKKGSEFVEFLRRRLILAREILSEDGSIFVHLDHRKSHHIKILMDEVFSESGFRNNIVWCYSGGGIPKNELPKKYDDILWYTKSNSEWTYNPIFREYSEGTQQRGRTAVKGEGAELRAEGTPINNWWTDVKKITSPTDYEKLDYPTQKSEELLTRIIKLTTNEGDIVLDFFGGSGTTMAVAEKLNRRWITCDLGKLSYFTMQKRILLIQDSKSIEDPRKKYNKKSKSFMTCTLGIYDLKKALTLDWDKYTEFVSELFEIDLKKHKISGFEFDGKKSNYSVKIWDYNAHKNSNVDEAYLKHIHQTIGERVSGRIYIIAPANNIDFLTDYYEVEGLRYYFLKIPYQIIRELHKIPFQKLRQPQSKKNVNDLDETIGFHFIKIPEVKSKLKISNTGVELIIKEFKSQYYKDEDGKVLENFQTLSAVFIDKKFDGKQFLMTDSYFADDLLPKIKLKQIQDDEAVEDEDIRKELKEVKKDGLKISFAKEDIGEKIMVVYTDIYGNDFTEVLNTK